MEKVSTVFLTNRKQKYGAVTAVYPESLKQLRKWMQEDFYVLPSGHHEVIVVPRSFGIPADELQIIVQEINKDEMDQEDILSNEVFWYKE